ncbi:MAG: acyl-CoA dehydrogenase family protein, partial [bacterium]
MTSHRDLDLFAPTAEHALLAETLAAFVAREVEPQASEHDRSETFNHALFRRAGELGLLGVTLPEEYGGAGLDAVAATQVCEALATADPGYALAVLAHAVLFAQNVNVNGNDVLRKRVLPKAASGEWIGGMCMTEPGVGTDVLAMATRARREGETVRTIGFSRLYHFMMRRVVGINLPATGADFFLIDCRVAEAFRQFNESNANFFALITWMGFRQAFISYDKQTRLHGRSGWTLEKKLKLA